MGGVLVAPILPPESSDVLGLSRDQYISVRTEMLDKSNTSTLTPNEWKALTAIYDYEIKAMYKRGDNVLIDIKSREDILRKFHPYIRAHEPELPTKKRSILKAL